MAKDSRHSFFVQTILKWYSEYKRDLPWRNTKDPYIIWLSEIILQQTRVQQGLPYFEKFQVQYPTVESLAAAPLEEIMRTWQGLGYYSRARNLHQCAQSIVESHDGKFPERYQELLKLKGIGSYTAAAIASFAFGEPVAVVDGNVFRLMSRYFGIASDIAQSSTKKEFEQLANELIPKEDPAAFNQGIMEFGSLQCAPRNPDCGSCPLSVGCFAFKNQLIEQLPVKSKKVKIRERFFQYYYIRCGRQLVVRKRPSGDIWEALHDFPMEEKSRFKELDREINFPKKMNNIFETAHVRIYSTTYKHLLTHQKIYAKFVGLILEDNHKNELVQWTKGNQFELIDEDQFERLGKPKLILRFLSDRN